MDERLEDIKVKLIALHRNIEDLRRAAGELYKDIEALGYGAEPDENRFISPDEVAKHYDISRQTVDRRLNEMEELDPRYSGCIIREHKCVRVQLRAYDDYKNNRDMLLNPRLRKSVPAYFKHL